jgi:hypothetical protein
MGEYLLGRHLVVGSRWLRFAGGALAAGALILLILTLIKGTPPTPVEQEWGMRECVPELLHRTVVGRAEFHEYQQAIQLCYSHLHGQGLLSDFKIRRQKFLQQSYDERILLWMVVLITLSGVALAGVQLVASFRLASAGAANFDQQTELSVEKGRLSVKSSLTGLLILICSFAFFWVFVYQVYVIHSIDPDGAPKGTPQLVGGGIAANPSAAPSAPTSTRAGGK